MNYVEKIPITVEKIEENVKILQKIPLASVIVRHIRSAIAWIDHRMPYFNFYAFLKYFFSCVGVHIVACAGVGWLGVGVCFFVLWEVRKREKKVKMSFDYCTEDEMKHLLRHCMPSWVSLYPRTVL